MSTLCVAHPGRNLVHRDGPCRCFFGGPGPEYPPAPQTPPLSWVLVEQAKGVVSAHALGGIEGALDLMHAHARHTGLTLTAVAAAVVDGSLDAQVLILSGSAGALPD